MTLAGTVDSEEIERFSKIADEWWNPDGKFRPLHRLNGTRVEFIRKQAEKHFALQLNADRPPSGLTLLDIGCGGGLVCEPMARLGFDVTGADASEQNIATAKAHATESGVTVNYRSGTAEALVAEGLETVLRARRTVPETK